MLETSFASALAVSSKAGTALLFTTLPRQLQHEVCTAKPFSQPLTHKLVKLARGHFYKHFEPKNELVAEACAQGFDEVLARNGCVPSMVADYLDEARLAEENCERPFVSLGSELARGTEAVRAAANKRFDEMLAKTEAKFKDLSADEARQRALAALAGMVGALTLARIDRSRIVARHFAFSTCKRCS